ncbi:PaaI family thioesterase [Sporosarcina sp. FSL K6-1522]|uniref:PaaI family thioesterase n=1 Tax=Sporosarcina sp. FSL K6-1522 TaxID=2921554 RepID=UPI0031599AE3
MIIERIRESFKQSGFAHYIGFEVDNIEEGNVQLKLSVREELLNSNGSIHGGVHASMLDTILGIAICSVTKTSCLTINLNVSYLNTSTSGELFATGRILKQGYRTAMAEGEIYDSNGVLLAKAVGTFKLLRN